MTKPGRTFSESWHRISRLKISLGPTVKARKQLFRGEIWYVLYDPFNNQYFRLRPEAYEFVVRLRRDRTVEEVWEECLRRNPEGAPGQEDVLQLLTQLYFANLLYFDVPADSAKLFDRYKKRRQREVRSKLLSIMFFRLPLLDPEFMLRKIKPLLKLIVGPLGAVIWLAVVAAAVKVVVDNFDTATSQIQGILSPANLPLLYLGLVIVKTIHEFGHAFVCKRFGGEVHVMGVMLLVFTPLPYIDATSSWSFRSRWHRALVGASGMIAEIFVAALAAFYWAHSAPGTWNSIAYNMMVIASVSTVLFNANPLLRFDGYYILSDLLDIPNLHTRSTRHLRHLCEYYLFGYRDSSSPAETGKEAFWLTVFGILSGIYKVVVFAGIILFVADKFLLLGLMMAFFCIFAWGVVPLYKFVVYLASSPRLARNRVRAVGVSLLLFCTIFGLLGFFPAPNRFRAPGVLESVNYVRVVNDAPGYVLEVAVPSGSEVAPRTPLMVFGDRELELEIQRFQAQRDETFAMELRARTERVADVEPILKRLETIEANLKNLERQKAELTVRARQQGIWVSPQSTEMVGTWLPRGTVLGEIVDPSSFRFSAVVSQEEAANLFVDQKMTQAEVRLYGQVAGNVDVTGVSIIPFQHERLPSAALGWRGGGQVAVSPSDEQGVQAAEPFFQIYAFTRAHEDVMFFHGRTGKLRFTLNSEPLLLQWGRKLRQLLQKRYQI
ncbi:MAG TPA: hypothetical protein ENN79_02820 [Desulfobacteraceae bacterium]|nr:hypothetical protein [Desulfobacteraceae bacterium]